MEVKTRSEKQTQSLAEKFAQTLNASDIIALFGDLGSGKTVFVQGLARGLGIKKRILSPSFVFVRSYKIYFKNKKLTFHHIDLYRGQKVKDFQSLGLDEIFSDDSIIAIEWADRIKNSLPKNRIDVYIEVIDEKTRRIKITSPSVIPSYTRDLQKAVLILKSGGIVIFPTDTVYGIGCRYNDQKTIRQLYQIKNTPKDQKFPILVSNISQVQKLAKITKVAQKLIDKYWPGGLTIILKSTKHKPGLRSGLAYKPGLSAEKLGFRMPNSKIAKTLIDQTGVPIIGTSANFHGQKPPRSFDQLDPKLLKLADFVIKGDCRNGIESTVVDTTFEPPKILRQGAIRL